MGHRMHHKGLWVTGVKIWCLGLCVSASMLMQCMDICVPKEDTLLTIPLVEYARDEQHNDPYLYKGLPPRNYLAKTNLSVLEHCQVLKASQHFAQNKQSVAGWESAFIKMLPDLPSGRTSASYVGAKLLPFAYQVAYDYPKFCIHNVELEDIVDAMIDLEFLGFDSARLRTYITKFDQEYKIFSDSAVQATEHVKDKLRHVAQMVGKELACDVMQKELRYMVQKEKEAFCAEELWMCCIGLGFSTDSKVYERLSQEFRKRDQARIHSFDFNGALLDEQELLHAPSINIYLLRSEDRAIFERVNNKRAWDRFLIDIIRCGGSVSTLPLIGVCLINGWNGLAPAFYLMLLRRLLSSKFLERWLDFFYSPHRHGRPY